MRTIRCTEKNLATQINALAAESSLFDPDIEQRTRNILSSVQDHGDQALLEFTQRFDGATLDPHRLAVTTAEFMTASLRAEPGLRKAVAAASRNIGRFSRRGLRKGWSLRNREGGHVGEKYDPFQRVGIYVPGGTAPLVSTALMTITLARVAGCSEIVVCTPCDRTGAVHSGLLYAIRSAGATEVYRVGGAQAVAALAYGTETVPRVQKIFGPGNAYVVMAKRLLFGQVSIDLLPGPSEVLVLADDTADPRLVAADLLAQAEHGSGHERVWLVTTSSPLITQARREIGRQLKKRQRAKLIRRALDNHGCLIHVKELDQAIRVANRLAPEHCEIMTRQAQRVANRIVTAGALFLGAHSPTVLGDYLAGPSHTLPTGGAGALFAGLTVDQFQRRTSVVTYDRKALRQSLSTVQTFAELEGLEAHGHSAAIRFERSNKQKRASR